jgi:hypothetical protein
MRGGPGSSRRLADRASLITSAATLTSSAANRGMKVALTIKIRRWLTEVVNG